MESLSSISCPCGKHMFDTLSRCPMCTQQRSSAIKQRYALPIRPTSKSLTPPPSQPGSPRRSTEVTVPASPQHPSRRKAVAGRALDSAFSFSFSSGDTEHEEAEDSDSESGGSAGRDIFPPRLYRTPSDRRNRTLSRTTSDSSRREISRESSIKSPVPAETKIAPPEVRSSRPAIPGDVAEAPMAAAFVRLSRKDGGAKEERRTRDLSARMFDGPA